MKKEDREMTERKFPPGKTPIGHGSFCFACHPRLDCFTRCCKDADMYLYPYDIIRMKRRLGIDSDTFLDTYTFSAIRDNPFFPNVMLRMSDGPEKPCPFLTSKGCRIYEDRPASCRTYPLERGVTPMDTSGNRQDFYFLKRHPYCLGHKEKQPWGVIEWVVDQGIGPYNRMNDLWTDMDSLFRTNPWGGERDKQLRMAFTACFNVDKFRDFVLNSSFRSRFNISENEVDRLSKTDEETMKLGFRWVRFFLTGQPMIF
jgi:Fe-S-cluster containining protein